MTFSEYLIVSWRSAAWDMNVDIFAVGGDDGGEVADDVSRRTLPRWRCPWIRDITVTLCHVRLTSCDRFRTSAERWRSHSLASAPRVTKSCWRAPSSVSMPQDSALWTSLPTLCVHLFMSRQFYWSFSSEPGLSDSHLVSSFTCSRTEPVGLIGTGFLVEMPFLYPNQQQQSTELNSEHCPHLGKITASLILWSSAGLLR